MVVRRVSKKGEDGIIIEVKGDDPLGFIDLFGRPVLVVGDEYRELVHDHAHSRIPHSGGHVPYGVPPGSQHRVTGETGPRVTGNHAFQHAVLHYLDHPGFVRPL